MKIDSGGSIPTIDLPYSVNFISCRLMFVDLDGRCHYTGALGRHLLCSIYIISSACMSHISKAGM